MDTAALVRKVAEKHTWDLLGVWARDPAYVRKSYPSLVVDGKVTFERVYAFMLKKWRDNYAGGRCKLCGGKASACGPRHMRGRSCA